VVKGVEAAVEPRTKRTGSSCGDSSSGSRENNIKLLNHMSDFRRNNVIRLLHNFFSGESHR